MPTRTRLRRTVTTGTLTFCELRWMTPRRPNNGSRLSTGDEFRKDRHQTIDERNVEEIMRQAADRHDGRAIIEHTDPEVL